MVPVVLVTAGVPCDVEVQHDPAATVADLLATLGEHGPVTVDGSTVPPERPLSEVLLAGSVVVVGGPPGRPDPGVDQVRFQLLTGPGAGMSVRLAPGRYVLGAGERAAIRVRARGVAARHAILEVTAGSVRLISGRGRHSIGSETVLVIGSVLAAVGSPPDPGPATVGAIDGTIPLNRRPRLPPRATTATRLPPPLPTGAPPRRLGWVALVVPLLFGLVAAVLVDPRLALFSVLGPLVMVGGWLDERRIQHRARRLAAARSASTAAELADALGAARAHELVRRRSTHPAVPMLGWWVERRSPRVWERRSHDGDFLDLAVGYGAVEWAPALTGPSGRDDPAVAAVLDAHLGLDHVPVTVALARHRILGVAGDRGACLHLARALLAQAVVLHGPSDLRVAVVTDRPRDWDWAKWLPHTLVSPTDRRRLLGNRPAEVAAVLERAGAAPGGAATLLIVDRGPLTDPSGRAVRAWLADPSVDASAVVVAATGDALPAECAHVVRCRPDGATLHGEGRAVAVEAAGVVEPVARTVAMGLARFRDPDVVETGAELPRHVALLELVGLAEPSAQAVTRRWSAAADGLDAWLGVAATGPLHLDLAADGPHALVAGTTGSGKSELLRTLIASLALGHDPDHVTFVLVDYKGGSAFDAAASFPHTVGLLTDLDGDLADRAVRCLEAELRHRERLLRDRGAPDVAAYRRLGGRMPRMVIVVDEFAFLARELPRFVASLVDVAARGRSLGIHLVLATQRPAGVVSDAIRANTAIRIALRVTDRADSTDVLGDPAAAAIGRHQAGRALVRTGPGGVTAFQAATVSSAGLPADRLAVRPFRFTHDPGPFPAVPEVGTVTDMERITLAVVEAAASLGLDPPRRPWPDPLPELIDTDGVVEASRPGAVVLGLADEPDEQRTRPFTWGPEDGVLGLYGAPGSGLTTTLETVVLGLAAGTGRRRVAVYVVDVGGGLVRWAGLAPVGAVVRSSEGDRVARLVRMLLRVIDRNRSPEAPDTGPVTVLVVDGLEALLRTLDSPDAAATRDGLVRVVAEGSGAGVVTVFAAARPGGVPAVVEAATRTRLVLRQADPMGAAALGVRGADRLPQGRAVHAGSGRHVQLAVPGTALIAAASAVTGPAPEPVGTLPDDVASIELDGLLDVSADRWQIPVGIADTPLAPVGIRIGPGEHVLVIGGPGSGRSTYLAALAACAERRRRSGMEAIRLIASGRGLTERVPRGVERVAPADLAAVVADIHATGAASLVLVDDVDETPADAVRAIGAARDGGGRVHVVAGARSTVDPHGPWVRLLAASSAGLWLRPSTTAAVTVWRTPLPRRFPGPLPPGRGLLVCDGTTDLVQAMRP